MPDSFQPQSRFHFTDYYNFDHPKGLKPHLQHCIVSLDTILSFSGSNGITPGPALSQRPLRRPDQIISSGIPTVGSRKEYPRSELSGGIQGPHNTHGEFWVSLHRNPSRDNRGDVDLDHRFWSTPLLSEVSEVPIPQAATAPKPTRAFPQGISKPGRERGDTGHGRNLPTAPGSGVWSPPHSRTTWWSLSECDLISERSAPEPPTQYRNIDVSQWVSEAIQYSPELPDANSWKSDKSDVVYLGEFRSPTDSRPSQPAPISPKHEPVSSNSGSATKRRIRRG